MTPSARGLPLRPPSIWASVLLATTVVSAQQPAPPPPPLVKEGATVKVTPHVYVIPDGNVPVVPNVGIVVGSRATLVVDTGLGVRNGEAIVRETAKVSPNARLYVVSTHFHPEHALGEAAFPQSANLLRARVQQQDIDEFGLALANTFASRSPAMADLLKGAAFRTADIVFGGELTLDLGGVHARVFALGPTHTRGDTMVVVPEEGVLFAGDVVMNHRFLAFASPYSSVRAWLASLDHLAQLRPTHIVPSHGDMGDASLIDLDRQYLTALQSRVGELKSQGKSADETAQTMTAEFQKKYPDWTSGAAVGPAAKSAYAEAK